MQTSMGTASEPQAGATAEGPQLGLEPSPALDANVAAAVRAAVAAAVLSDDPLIAGRTEPPARKPSVP